MASSTPSYRYDVFLSFRGEDTRFGFTGNLHSKLIERGIKAFIDDSDLHKGMEITPSLVQAIEGSRIAIVVLSLNYATSSFCLNELVKIMKCRHHKNQLVIPVFYDVEPYHVRELKGTYGEALAAHERALVEGNTDQEKLQYYKMKKRMQKWRNTLNDVANLSGYHFQLGYGYECDHITKIVEDVSKRMRLDSRLQNSVSFRGDLHINLEGNTAGAPADEYKYDVFLSFRKETRFGFTSTLHSELNDRDIRAFIADLDLVKGMKIGPSLAQAIETSRTAIVVLSKSYAYSSFCLDELVKIMDCRHHKNQLVIPVFYDVEPYHVRELKGTYGEALAQHENTLVEGNTDQEKLHYYKLKKKVQKWRDTLNDVANLSGYHFQHGYGNERDHIMKIVEDMSTRMRLDSRLQNSILLQGDLHISLEGNIAPTAAQQCKYDVFLSFRKETRFGFTGTLLSALKDRGITAFIADLDLMKGAKIAAALLQAIERSKIAIVVLSKKYAFSSFCLDELVNIMDCLKGKGGLVIPVFYHVDPCHVRWQSQDYGEALADHERRETKPERMQRWRVALKQVADLSGHHVTPRYGYERDVVAKLVEQVSTEIGRDALPGGIHPAASEFRSTQEEQQNGPPELVRTTEHVAPAAENKQVRKRKRTRQSNR